MARWKRRSFGLWESRPAPQLWLFRVGEEFLGQVRRAVGGHRLQGAPSIQAKFSELFVAEEEGSGPLLIKRLRAQKEAHYVRRYLLCQGKREFFGSARLREIGVHCPEPIGYAVNLIPWSWLDSIFISRFVPGAVTATQWVRAGGTRREQVIGAVARDLRRMLEHHLFYRDLHTENLLVREGPGPEGFSLYWIDNEVRRFGARERGRKRELLVARWLEVAQLTPEEKVWFESELERGK